MPATSIARIGTMIRCCVRVAMLWGVGVSDLRTRIAAVAQNHVRCDDCTFAKTPEQRYLHFADAVIRRYLWETVND